MVLFICTLRVKCRVVSSEPRETSLASPTANATMSKNCTKLILMGPMGELSSLRREQVGATGGRFKPYATSIPRVTTVAFCLLATHTYRHTWLTILRANAYESTMKMPSYKAALTDVTRTELQNKVGEKAQMPSN